MWEGRSSREELLLICVLIWTNSSPHSHPLCGTERGRSKAETVKKRAGGRCCNVCLSKSILISNYFFPMAVKVNDKCPYVVPYLYIVP